MSFENDVELINGYNEWVLERKRLASDLTPEAYLADRMKQEAADRVIEAVDWFDNVAGKYHPEDRAYDYTFTDEDVHNLEKILRGDL